MNTTKTFQRILIAILIASMSLTLAPVSAAQAQSKVFLPAVQSDDKCIAAQFAEPSAGLPADCPPPGSSAGVARADFNGDGFSDLTVGIPRKDGSRGGKTLEDSGAVNIIYGSADGLTSKNNQLWSEDTPDISGQSEAGDYFGSAVAAGDFNGDHYSDLAIGIPGKDLSGASNAGAVQVLYGGPNGLSATGNQFWIQGAGPNGTLLDKPEQNDRFGSSLAWGDFNHDGFGDLAIGVIYESIVSNGVNISGAGAVQIMYGSPSGLKAAANQFWQQDSPGIDGVNEAGDQFGYTLAGGDFNGDHYADLAIGVPDEDISSGGSMIRNAGAVNVLYGGPNGLAANAGPGDQGWSQGSSGIQGAVEADDHFGMALAVGDFNHDGRSDLAIGTPYEDVGDIRDAGAVNVIYGSTQGLTATGNEIFDQDSSGTDGSVDDVAETGDLFGWALAAGDFDGDGFQDLAVGVPHEDNRIFFDSFNPFDDLVDSGGFNLLVGYGGGLTTDPNNFFFAGNDDHPNGPCCMTPYSYFGQSLTAWNFGKGSKTDLAVGATGTVLFQAWAEGIVSIFYGPLNEDSPNNEIWRQGTPGILGDAETSDDFGITLY